MQDKYYITEVTSFLGPITLASDGTFLKGAWFKGQKYFGASVKGTPERKDDLDVFDRVRDWLAIYFAGKNPPIDQLDLQPEGSPFRKRVWQILCEIPYGETTTYKEIANKIAAEKQIETMSPQAVGGAVGHNPISIIIPCHRVLGTDGSLTGYAGGLDKKRKLLELENAVGHKIGDLK